MTKILACIDGSDYASSVCDHAAWAAKRLGSGVLLFHALGREAATTPVAFEEAHDTGERDTLAAELEKLAEQRARLAQQRGRALLEQAQAKLRGEGIDNIVYRLRHGDVVETVIEAEETTDFVVIGKRGEAADFASAHLGSNLERVVRGSSKPILVASRAFQPITTFLVAFDGGTSCMKAIDFIAGTELLKGASGQLLMVGNPSSGAEAKLWEADRTLRDLGFEIKSGIVPGDPDEVIAERVESDGVDLVVMGAYGHSRIRQLIIGSTTTEMIRSCKVPVLLFR
ncbi:universal stress protein [Mangrovibrevibacter kandeliae]|uniref:universal stress protein n=1 Tax=Mangrovibrevibacter kandeliae TaxID=2968473 RepID=UPI002117996D|nr:MULTISPECIES: universal stress protein [unclassified Aurantimonas]MCQ8781500.1 universal stress protein [Aurantimonas sp. CSK15Z-1]MCW4114277.1 universal stress protein [Aurantimonas sp. MSK8Z-1]